MQYQLPSNEVSAEPLKALHDAQRMMELKVAHKINEKVLAPCRFDKMKEKVSLAVSLFSKETEAAIRFMVEMKGWSKSYLTTAWFIGFVRRWFNIMTSRTPNLALSKLCMDNYNEAVTFLESELFFTPYVLELPGNQFKRQFFSQHLQS